MIKRMRDFPKSRQINGVTYRVRFRRHLFWEGQPVFGLCHYDKKLIEICMGLSSKMRDEVYWHEIMHALAFEHGIRLAHPTIYNLQGAWAEFMRENGISA